MASVMFTVPQSHCVAIERLGKFNRIARQGLRIGIPIIERVRLVPEWGTVANKRGYLIELTEQQTDTKPRQCHTKDNVSIHANASVYWRIVDPVKALYEVDILPVSVSDLALNALRSNVGALELDEILSEREKLSEMIAAQLAKVSSKWGVQFTRVEIQDLETNKETSAAMLQQMEAERKRRATVVEAEGRAAAELRVAEAERDAMVARAQGRAKALELIADAETNYLRRLGEGLSTEQATRVLIAQKYIDGFDRISRNPADKVYLPNGFNGLFSLPAESGGVRRAGGVRDDGAAS